MLLEGEATLPLAAERSLDGVLRHEMDRLTPFAAADLFWSWRIERRDPALGRLLLRLAYVPKAGLRTLLAAMDAAALRPASIEITSGGRLHRIGMTAPGSVRAGRGGAVAAGACAVLAVAALAVPVVRQEAAIAAVDARMEALRPRVEAVDALRRKLQGTASGAEAFAAEAARVGDALQALAAVTQTLPDDSYLTQFALQQRKLTLTGRSAAAARLNRHLVVRSGTAEPGLRRPRHPHRRGARRPVHHPRRVGAVTALPTGRRGQALALALLALLMVALWVGVVAPALAWYGERGEVLAQRQALAVRMAQLAASAPGVQATLDAIAASGPPARAVLDGATDAIAGAALQQQVEEMTTQAGASLTSAEALPAEQAGAYRRIGLHVSVSGVWPVVVALFAAIDRATPRMLVDDLALQSGLMLGPNGATHPLEASFTVLAFHTGTGTPR